MAPVKTYTVVGLGKISGVSIGGATLAVFDVPTAASILNKSGYDEHLGRGQARRLRVDAWRRRSSPCCRRSRRFARAASRPAMTPPR